MVSRPPDFEAFRDDERWQSYGRLLYTFVNVERRVAKAMLNDSGLSWPWFEVMYRLAAAPDFKLTMGALASQVLLTGATVSRLIDRMEVPGYVLREQSQEDRRVFHVSLTEAGSEALAGALKPLMEAIDVEYYSKLKPSDVKHLNRIMWILYPHPSDTRGGRGPLRMQ